VGFGQLRSSIRSAESSDHVLESFDLCGEFVDFVCISLSDTEGQPSAACKKTDGAICYLQGRGTLLISTFACMLDTCLARVGTVAEFAMSAVANVQRHLSAQARQCITGRVHTR
jgi:hypothetical protein